MRQIPFSCCFTTFRSSCIVLFISLLTLASKNIEAQIAKEHYLPPLFGVQSKINAFKLVLTTLEQEPFTVTITNGDGSYREEVEISMNSPQEITPQLSDGTIIGFPFAQPSNDVTQSNLDPYLNTVIKEHGLILKGAKPFFANYMTLIPSQGEILTSKGTAGLGTKFFAGHQHMSYGTNTNNIRSHFTSVMATEDNTFVEFNNRNLLFHGQTQHTFSVTLDAGESYIIGNTLIGINEICGSSYECTNGYNGTKITATKNITVNSGSIHGGYSENNNDSRDMGVDQIVPIEYTGTEFILIEGNGGPSNSKNEVAIVIATEDNTQINVNGNSDLANTYTLAQEGDYVVIPWEQYSNNSLHLNSNKNIYVYQTLAGSTSSITPGLMFIPRLTKDATREILISGTGMFFNPSKTDDIPQLYLVTETDATVTINGKTVPHTDSLSVDGTTDWVAYRITDISPYGDRFSDFHITSTKALNAAITFKSESHGGGGYYSGFSENEAKAGVGAIGVRNYTLACEKPINLLAAGGIEYSWNSNNTKHWDMVKRVNDSTYTFTPDSDQGEGPFIYTVISEVQIIGGTKFDTTSLAITVAPIDMQFGGDQFMCIDGSVVLNGSTATIDIDDRYNWSPAEFLNHSSVISPTASGLIEETEFRIIYDDGHCRVDTTITVAPEDCGHCNVSTNKDKTLCLGESITLTSEGRGDFVRWEYEEEGEPKEFTTASPSVSPITTTTYTVHYNNAIKENATDPWDPDYYCPAEVTITVESCEKEIIPAVELLTASIHDEDHDGIAETLYLTFDNKLERLPEEINSINWPEEGVNDISAYAEQCEFVESDSSIIKVYLPDVFKPATEASIENQPTLSVESKTVVIEDNIGAVILEASKKTPEHYQYGVKNDNQEITFFVQSDTITLLLSEKISIPDDGWDSLFIIQTPDEFEYLVPLKKAPYYSNDNDYALILVIDNKPGSMVPHVENEISIVEKSSAVDIFKNEPYEHYISITGLDRSLKGFGNTFRDPVIGHTSSKAPSIVTDALPLYDAQGIPLDTIIDAEVTLGTQWIPPVQFQDGKLAPGYQCSETDISAEASGSVMPMLFESQCNASLVIGSYKQEGSYSTKIYVYDHLGQFIFTWTQHFGVCGEFENEYRKVQSGIDGYFLNDLVWNMKDHAGRKVGSGVYYWRIVNTYDSGYTTKITTSMGIARQSEGCTH